MKIEDIYKWFRCDVYFEVRETNGTSIFKGTNFFTKHKNIYERELASIAYNDKHIILYAKKESEGK